MASIKQIKTIIFAATAITSLVIGSVTISPVSALSGEQSDAIAQNCNNIKQSLTQLQRVDSRTRTYLGSAYEAISVRFITPLNLRLVRNGQPSSDLFNIQNDFTEYLARFRDSYVDYMRELDALIAINCSVHPDVFYERLEVVRQRRETLRLAVVRLNELAESQYQAVSLLRKVL